MTKIGITCQWHSRSKSLKIGEKTQLLGLFQADELAQAEKELHDTFKDSRLPGSEYFNLNKNQIKELLSLMTAKYQNVEKYYNYYNNAKKSKKLEITNALDSSASDWFRLCKTSWLRSIIQTAKNDLYSKNCFFNYNDFNIFEKQISNLISLFGEQFCNTYANWFLELHAAETIWYELADNFECWINKNKLKKTCRYNHNYGRYYSKYKFIKPKFEDLDPRFPDSILLKNTNCIISKSTCKVIYSIVCKYRFIQYIERAFECADDNFTYYYNEYGPTQKNKLLAKCGNRWIDTFDNY